MRLLRMLATAAVLGAALAFFLLPLGLYALTIACLVFLAIFNPKESTCIWLAATLVFMWVMAAVIGMANSDASAFYRSLYGLPDFFKEYVLR